MHTDLFIDIETFSSEPIKDTGLHKYIASPDFEIILISYAFDDGPVITIDLLSGDSIANHEDFEEALFDEDITKHAHNIQFERTAFKRIGYSIPVSQWRCTMVKAAYCGLPLSLDNVSKVLNLKNAKLASGTLLIKYFSCPCKPSIKNGMQKRNYPENDPVKWQEYIKYNVMDVEAEREIFYILRGYDIPIFEQQLFELDQIINEYGVEIDINFAKSCINMSDVYSKDLSELVTLHTGIANPNSDAQVKSWIFNKTGILVDSLAKDSIAEVLESFKGNKLISFLLNARNQLSKSSVKKYTAMINCANKDKRARGLFQFYGANRTGRWAGRLIQVQNLPQNHIPALAYIRNLVKTNNIDDLSLMYENIATILSQLIRTAFVAKNDHTFGVSDFSAIEARVISWYANEAWRMEVFFTHGKIYEATAARMFNLPIEMITKGSDLRQKGKVAELALGYQGAVGALERMGGASMGLTEGEMRDIIKKWRLANPNIVKFWKDLEDCAVEAVRWPGKKVVSEYRGLVFQVEGFCLTVQLPSGRKLFYYKPRLKAGKYNKSTLCYEGIIQDTKIWGSIDTYGGKLAENIVQATARDLLGYSMLKVQEAGIPIVMHIHDEIVAEIPKATSDEVFKQMILIMSTPVPWCSDLPLRADGYITDFYKKD